MKLAVNNIITSMQSDDSEIQDQGGINRMNVRLTNELEIITKTELNENQDIATFRGQYQKYSQQKWFETDQIMLTNKKYQWKKTDKLIGQRISDILLEKEKSGDYMINAALNNRSLGLCVQIEAKISRGQSLQIYSRTNAQMNNKQGYKITILNFRELSIKIGLFKNNKFKMWREIQIPTNEDNLKIKLVDSGTNHARIQVNNYEIEMLNLIPIFTDFYIHIKKSKGTQLCSVEVSYFDRLPKKYGCDCSSQCLIF